MFSARTRVMFAVCCLSAVAHAQPAAEISPEPASLRLQSFAEAKQLLAAHQPGLQQQLAALARANAQVEQAYAQLLPRLELSAGADYAFVRRPPFVKETQFLDSHSFIPNATASLAVTFSLSRLRLLDAAQQLVAAERQGLSATRHQLIGALASALLGLLSAERVAARNAAGYAAAQERMRLTRRLQEVGRITAVDALRFAQDLSESRSELLSAVESLSEAREAVGSALGVSAAVGFGDGFDPAGLLTQAGSGCRPIAALAARPDRQAASQRLAQAETAARASRLSYLPELRLQSLYSARLSTKYEPPYPESREVVNDWGARANLVWTVYDGGQRAAEVQRADAEVLRLRAAADQLILDTDLEQRRSQRLVSVTRENLGAAQASVEAGRKLDELSRKALELGAASSLEVVDAARRLRAVEITLALREVEALSAQLRARLALAVCE